MTDKLSAYKYPTLSLVYLVVYHILQKSLTITNSDSPGAKSCKRAMKNKLNEQYFARGYQKFLEMQAAALDPRFKHLSFSEEHDRQETCDELKINILQWNDAQQSTLQTDPDIETSEDDVTVVTQAQRQEPARADPFEDFVAVPASSQQSSSTQPSSSEAVDREFRAFLSEPLPTAGAKARPLDWWRQRKEKYPLLIVAVRKLFACTATSVPAECVFSTAGDIVTKKRNSLLPDNIDMLILLYINKHLD